MQVRCVTCGTVLLPLGIHLDTRLEKTRIPSDATDEALLHNPNRQLLDSYFLLDCCRMRVLTHINKHDQFDNYHSHSTLLNNIYPKRALPAPTDATHSDILLTNPSTTRIRYESARKFRLCNITLTMGNFLRQVLLDDCWIPAMVASDDDTSSSVVRRCVDNADVIRATLQQVPITAPVPEKSLRSPQALHQHYREFCDRYYGFLHFTHTSKFRVGIATTKHLQLFRQDTQALDAEMTLQAIPSVMVEPNVAAAIPIATLRHQLHLAQIATPELKWTHITLQPVCAIWNKTFNLFSQVKFEMTPDQPAIDAYRTSIRERSPHASEQEIAQQLKRVAREVEPHLRYADRCDFTLRMAAPYYSYEFAWTMVFATVQERLHYFLTEVLPSKPIAHFDGSYDPEFVIAIGDTDFLRDFERPGPAVPPTLTHPTNKYGYLLSQYVLDEYREGPTRVLKSALMIDHVDRPTANWHIVTLLSTASVDDVRALIQDAVVSLMDRYRLIQSKMVNC